MTIGGKVILLGFGGAVILLVVLFGGEPAIGQAAAIVAVDPMPSTSAVATARIASTPTSMPAASSVSAQTQTATAMAAPLKPAVKKHDDSVIEMGKPIPSLLEGKPVPVTTRAVTQFVSTQLTESSPPSTVTIGPGDTLSEISQRTLGSAKKWSLLVEANPGLDPSRLRIGQTIKIPGLAAAPRPASAANASLRASQQRTYRVAQGDTLTSIAIEHYGDADRWDDVFAANSATMKGDPDRLRIDMVLVLP